MITIKSAKQIEKMRASAKIAKEAVDLIEKAIRPGVSTAYLDKIAHDYIVSKGARPNFLNYGGFPGSICASVNDEVVHGIPSKHIILQEGDIISIDMGAVLDGWHSDMARTFGVGKISPEAQQLIDVTKQSFFEGLKFLKHGARLGDVSHAIQEYAESFGYGVVRDLVGHGIGQNLHEDPSVPNFGKAGHGVKLAAGMTLAIEPMITAGTYKVSVLDDDWTVVTDDGSLAAHYENTVVITKDGYEILTL
ncbi:MAG: type I methionyl aminopeptidase [Clostridia bacterium]|nr:type I methionyl aminopeptidase [Clostridia bacterium]MBQ6558068.1 type I methionyl aminopeptidase [Clostridia bacterium]MBQ9599569.1 type I methionyl aminopeptidase [Clostridia bacterium]MBR0028117.1 type I methionyl aminopeptidase [Clostridia bacterium]